MQTDKVFTRKEYIEREAAIAETRKPRLTDAELRIRLANIPAADVVPVRHGRWEPLTMSADDGVEVLWVHAKCGCERYEKSHYCPNCGALMDKDGDGE